MERVYRLRSTVPPRPTVAGKTKGRQHHELTVPVDIAHTLLEQGHVQFTCELTAEGVLYRPWVAQEP